MGIKYRRFLASVTKAFNRLTQGSCTNFMMELTTGAIFMLSSLYGNGIVSDSQKEVGPVMLPKEEVAVVEVIEEMPSLNPITLEDHVREYFKDTPILAEIAFCESRFRHYDSKGRVIRGEINSDDVGVMQINEYYHKDTASKLGLDIESLDGNMAYAKWLYSMYGDSPWVYSSKCWKNKKIAMAK